MWVPRPCGSGPGRTARFRPTSRPGQGEDAQVAHGNGPQPPPSVSVSAPLHSLHRSSEFIILDIRSRIIRVPHVCEWGIRQFDRWTQVCRTVVNSENRLQPLKHVVTIVFYFFCFTLFKDAVMAMCSGP